METIARTNCPATRLVMTGLVLGMLFGAAPPALAQRDGAWRPAQGQAGGLAPARSDWRSSGGVFGNGNGGAGGPRRDFVAPAPRGDLRNDIENNARLARPPAHADSRRRDFR